MSQAALTNIAIESVYCNESHQLHHVFMQQVESGRGPWAWRQRVPPKMAKSRLKIETRLGDSPDMLLEVRC